MNYLIPNSEVTDFDPAQLTAQNLIAVRFGKSTSASYDMAIEFAQRAAIYREVGEGRKKQHLAVFARSIEQAELAIVLLEHALSWKSTMVFAGGRLLVGNAYEAILTLKCFVEASQVRDPRAFCQVAVPDFTQPIFGEIEITHTLPCRRLYGGAFHRPTSGIDPSDHLQAVAVKESCHWCPLFSLGAYEKKVEDRSADPVRKFLGKIFGG